MIVFTKKQVDTWSEMLGKHSSLSMYPTKDTRLYSAFYLTLQYERTHFSGLFFCEKFI
jgi:hypothetical protein